jgi:hypothetical protein
MFIFAVESGAAVRVAHVRVAAASLVALAAVLGTSACGGGSDTKVVFPAACATPTYKPTSIVVTCADANTVVRNITWSSYTDKSAAGTGTANVNACDPTCAAGRFQEFPAKVGLSGPTECGKDTTQFERLVLTYTGARPPGAGSTTEERFPCHGP